MTRSRTIILADDHALVRAGLRSLLETLPGYEVVAEAGDGLKAMELVRKHQPDVLLLDITLRGLNGLEMAAMLKKQELPTRILMVSMHAGAEYVARALSAGALGYLIKDSAFDELASALDTIFLGRRYLSRSLDPEVIKNFEQQAQEADSELAVLTPRQRQILQLIAEGLSTRDIAERLHVSIKTVEAHRAGLMERLGIHDVAGLVRFAIRVGLIAPDA